MRIGIDATCWANERGYGRFTREIVSAMVPQAPGHEFVCILDDRSDARFGLSAPNVRKVVVSQSVSPTQAAASGSRRSVGDMLRLSNAARRERVDVFFSPSVYSYFPLPPGMLTVVTIHDAIAERFPDLTLPTSWDRWFWRLKVAVAIRQARIVLTVSDYAAREITRHLGVPAARLRVTLEGVAAAFRPAEDHALVARAAVEVGVPAGSRWLMYVGGFGPHKYVDALVRAHAQVAARLPGSPLILLLAGPPDDGFHSDSEGVRRAIAECGTERLVRWVGYLPDDTLRLLHSGAVALALVSASEGFGLPAVEAASCGTPVIATTESPLPELLEGGGVFVKPGDVNEIARALERLLTDEPARRALGARALERTRALSWSKSAAVVLAALEEAAAHRRKVA